MIGFLAIIGGAQGWEDMETYGISHEPWLSKLLPLPNGIPKADTYRRLFQRLSPKALEESFQGWLSSLVKDLDAEVVAIDGKQLKGSYDRNQGQSALHLVSAWASEQKLMLSQAKVADKSNEISAIPILLNLLDLSGSVVTLDAIGTQHEIATQIQDQGADYVLALKANHPTLHRQVTQGFEQVEPEHLDQTESSTTVEVESGHHRTEKRRVCAVSPEVFGELHQQSQWKGLKSIVQVERTRRLWNKTTHEVMFYLSSLAPDALKVSQVIRKHWSIENQLHWVLDINWGEDDCRVRTLDAPDNLALLRRWSLNLLNQETSYKRSTRQKMKRAAMDSRYMLKVLQSLFSSQSTTEHS
jgi:predicted transposase YbfD/YdcC